MDKSPKQLNRIFTAIFAAVLCFSTLTPARAEEISEETTPFSETTAPETTVPETCEPTETVQTVPTSGTLPTAEPSEPEETIPLQAETAKLPAAELEPAFSCPYNLYYGLLHAHTDISDGVGSVTDAFRYAANVEGMDFFAVTDHSNSFDNAEDGGILLEGASISPEWAAGKAAAAAVTDETFLGIFGYEMTWQEGKGLGHICTFNTPGWESRNQEP